MAKSIVSRDQFTVGWICTLPIELAAATEMLDENFADLPSRGADSNVYTLGKVGTHNVVVACLPAGQIGASQVAAAASKMRLSFPSLRFGVLVGVGGGVPRHGNPEKVDIRLGDVILSQPAGQSGGVIQYDYGETGTGGVVTSTGSLNAPPNILLNALNTLRLKSDQSKTLISTHLAKLSSIPKFRPPGPGQDKLYCAASQMWVKRDERDTPGPVLFFGNIASGNQVLKDGPTRDRYSHELGGIICFETEAAGLMNSFPCIDIRGVCNYADEHKNENWQPYAAATAAACARELLLTVPSLARDGGSSPGGASPETRQLQQGPVTPQWGHPGTVFHGPVNARFFFGGNRVTGPFNMNFS